MNQVIKGEETSLNKLVHCIAKFYIQDSHTIDGIITKSVHDNWKYNLFFHME